MQGKFNSYYWLGFLRIEFIGAILLVIFLFLPWLHLDYTLVNVSIKGYALPDMAEDINKIYKEIDEIYDFIRLKPKKNEQVNALYLVYLIPVLAGLIIILQFFQKPITIIVILLSILIIGGFIYIYFEYGNKIFDILAIGAYLSLTTASIMLIAISRIFNPLIIKMLIKAK